MDRINGADFVDLGGGKRGFRDEDLPTGTPGTVVTADFLNAAQEELIGIIEASGLVPNAADRGQLAKAIQTGRLNYVAAAGTANAITGTLTPAPAAYTIGMRITLKIANPNTGPATLNLNGLGVKSIVASDGSALVANDLSGLVSLVYNGTAFVLDTLIAATETNRGVVQLASLGEVFAGTDLMKPAAIGRVASMVQSGYWRWGSASGTANALKITLPLAPASYTFGLLVSTLVQTPNTGPATVNVNGLGVVPVQYADGSDLAPNDLFGSISLLFDGSRFVLIRTVPATTANRGIMRLATQAEMAAGTPGTGAAATPGTTAQTVQSGTWNFATAGGTANALTASLTPAPAALSTGMLVCLFLNVANTGPSTLDLNGLGAKGIFYSDSTSVGAGDLFGKVLLMYDGGAWILLNNRVATQGIRGNARFATAAEMNAGARADLAGSPATIAQAIQSGQWLISGTTGTANAYVAALTPAIASYVTGMVINIWFHTPNTGPSTININGLGNRSIAPQNDPTLVANDLYGWTSLV